MPTSLRLARRSALASLAACLALPAGGAAQTIDTGPPAAPSALTPLWLGGAFNRGQSFTVVPSLTTLTRFDFYLSSLANFETMTYRAFVAAWDPATRRTVGPLLWQSDPIAGVAASSATLVAYAVPDLALTPGATYIAILSSAGLNGPGGGTPLGAVHLAAGRDSYAGGEGYSLFAGLDDPAALTTNAWTSFGELASIGYVPGEDFAFKATLVSPEPSTWALLAGGLAMLAGAPRRRRR